MGATNPDEQLEAMKSRRPESLRADVPVPTEADVQQHNTVQINGSGWAPRGVS